MQKLSIADVDKVLSVLCASLDDPESFVYLLAIKSIGHLADKGYRQHVADDLTRQFSDPGIKCR
jgi:hypothetical protein